MFELDKLVNDSLKIDCGKCFGFCCVALFFAASDGFPADKAAGTPCSNLLSDFRCSVHKELRQMGLKGCTIYDCFGAGQKIAQKTYGGRDWSSNPDLALQMYDAFLVVRQLHEMLWYLNDAYRHHSDDEQKTETYAMIKETLALTELEPVCLIELDLTEHRSRVNAILAKTSELVRYSVANGRKSAVKRNKKIAGRLNLIGAKLENADLSGEDLRGALMIAANLKGAKLGCSDMIGADIRDADLSGANLESCLYLTQIQINSAKGDAGTKLPKTLLRPEFWEKE